MGPQKTEKSNVLDRPYIVSRFSDADKNMSDVLRRSDAGGRQRILQKHSGATTWRPIHMQPLCGRDAYNYVHASILWFCDLKQNGTPFGWKSGSDPKTGTFVSLAGKEDSSAVRNQV